MQQQIQETISSLIRELYHLQELLSDGDVGPEVCVDEVTNPRASYTAAEAEEAKAQIEVAYQRGLLGYDKKRGMKMVVTKSTEGWRPRRRRQ